MKSLCCAFLLASAALASEPPKPTQASVSIYKPEPETSIPHSILNSAVNVIGQVNAPQAVKTDTALSVLDAMAAAGGANRLSSRTDFSITTPSGLTMNWKGPSFDSPEGKEFYSRIMVNPGDVLYVPDLCRL